MSQATDADVATTDGATADAGAAPGADTSGAPGADRTPEDEIQRQIDRAISKAHERLKREYDEKLVAERKKVEEEKLRAQGEYQKLFEERDAELRAVRAEQAAAKHRADTLQVLTDKGLSEFSELFLAGRDTIDAVAQQADAFKAKLDAVIEARVLERLDTGARPSGTTSGAPTRKLADMTPDQKAQFIEEHGLAAFVEQRLSGR